jgi:hypothetical protein
MLLARLTCASRDAAAPLVARLERLGYRVEVVAAASAPPPPALPAADPPDLEIQVEECTIQDALQHAEVFAAENPRAQIFVAPRVLTSEAADSAETAPSALQGIRSWLRQKLFRANTGDHVVPFSSVRYPPGLTSLNLEQRDVLSPAPEQPAQIPEREPEKSPQVAPAASDAVAVNAAGPEIPAAVERAVQLKPQAEEERERSAHEAATATEKLEVPAAALHSLKEAQDPQTEAGEGRTTQAMPAAAAGQDTTSGQLELENVSYVEAPPAPPPAQPIATPDQQSCLPEPPAKEHAVPIPAPLPSRKQCRPAPAARVRPRSFRRVPEWQIAAMGGAAFAVLLMGAWSLLTSPSPPSPLPSRQIQPAANFKQEVPFGPVTITNQPPALPVQPRATAPPAPLPQKPRAAISTPRLGNLPVKRSARSHARPLRGSSPADEVVVHHFNNSSAGPPFTNTQARAGTKRISDMD